MDDLSARRRVSKAALILSIAVGASVLVVARSSQPVHAVGRDYWPVPAAASTQPLGVIPAQPDSANGSDKEAPIAAGRGIPLGGIGAGSFMYNQAGTFGPFELRSGLHEERILSQAALHLREQVDGSAPLTRTLATPHPLGSVLPAWTALSPGDGTYSALYPYGWTSYAPFADDVSVKFWSPFVAGNDQWSSQPVAYFDVRLANHTTAGSNVSVMLTFPNAPLSVTDPRPNTRTGLYSNVVQDSATKVTAVTLGASSPSNVVDAQDTEWTIAARPGSGQNVSYLTSWNGAGNGSDVWNQFTTGALSDGATDSSASAGAIAVSTRLLPGQVQVVHLALAWDFPRVLFGSPTGQHTVWMKRYTSFFGTQETPTNDYVAGSYPGRLGAKIAEQALANETQAAAGVNGWWNKITQQSAYPVWLRRAALNELYYDVFGSSFWESGLVENTFPAASIPQFGTPNADRIGSQIPGTHLFGVGEGKYPYMESYDVRAYQSRQLLTLFPEIERDVQRAWTEFILQDQNGHAPHDAGLDQQGNGGPYIMWPGYPSKQEAWLDLPAKYLVQSWEYYKATSDASFLRFAYPAMKASYQFMLASIPSGEHLPVDNGADNTYDTWGLHGTTSYVGGLWILAQEVMQAANDQAVALGIPGSDPALSTSIAAEVPNSRAEYETRLYDPTHKWYRISTGDTEYGDGVMADATFAEWVAERDGLPDVVSNLSHLQAHLRSSYQVLVKPFHDSTGHNIGAANGVDPNGSIIQTGGREATEVWTGVSYLYAATLYSNGKRLADSTLVRDGLAVGSDVAYETYSVAQRGYAFNTPEAWLDVDVTQHRAMQYSRPRAVWELLLAIQKPF